MDTKELLSKWANNIKPIFPDDAAFQPHEKSDPVIRIDWALKTDPDRPNKRSVTIEIKITFEAIEDYKLKTASQQESDDRKLYTFVRAQLSSHNPEHSCGINEIPPVVTWPAGSSILNS